MSGRIMLRVKFEPIHQEMFAEEVAAFDITYDVTAYSGVEPITIVAQNLKGECVGYVIVHGYRTKEGAQNAG